MTGVTVGEVNGTVIVRVPMVFKRRAGRKEVIVPAGLGEAPAPAAQEPLVVALARAFLWQELLDAGAYGSVTELAAALGVDRKYVARVVSLACLAPDLVEAIVAGREPSGISLERLVKGVPMGWEEQRALLLG